VSGVKAKKRLMRVEWTDVFSEQVPVVSATPLEMLAAKRFVEFMQRGARSRATRSATNKPQRNAKVFTQV
jgi:hypothetical protein